MSTPESRHPIDPLSQALGRIEGHLEGLDKRLDERFGAVEVRFTSIEKRLDDTATKAELRAWSSVILLLVGALLALVLRGHGG
jgi:hypothetical protein